MSVPDVQHKRAVLFSARLRFSPETQPIRETAIDKIVEQNLLLASSEDGLTLQEIEKQGVINFSGGAPVFSRRDLQASLTRLASSERVAEILDEENEAHYRLSTTAQEELWAVQRTSERRVSSVVMRLFKNITGDCQVYEAPFVECLSIIFAQLGEAYVRLLKGDLGHQDVLAMPLVQKALRVIKEKYPEIDIQVFEVGVITFFRDSHPDYDAIKWNMGQNYYVAKALGIDPTGQLLSAEVFGGAKFYLDTNVIISALEPMARHHSSFQAFSKACERLGIKLFFCQISLDELASVLERNRELIAKVADQIPEATAPKVNGVFYRVYRDYKTASTSSDFDDAFSNFFSPMKTLVEDYQAELVDDVWFEKSAEEKATQVLANKLRQVTESRRGWPKATWPAQHDALLLRWIDLERKKDSKDIWFVTLDNSLPGVVVEEGGQPIAITLDALLQWISPVAFPDDSENGVAAAFSEAVKYQLLPQETFFGLQDFLVFAEMEWSCKELPAEDVEACIRYVKLKAPELDPATPTDREKIAHEISKFFADPGRKYKQELERLEAEKQSLAESYTSQLGRAEGIIQQQRAELDIIKKEQARKEQEQEERQILRSARVRALSVVLLWLIAEAGIVYLALLYSEGDNAFQQVVNFWPFLALVFTLFTVIFVWFLGKERLRLLGEPVSHFLGLDKS
jgi:hypothetical protein